MYKMVALFTGLAVVSTSALAQVRPQDCRPVFPHNDPVADLVTERALPAAAQRRGFLGLPLLPLLLAGAGGIVAATAGDDDDDNNDQDETVSPA